MKIENKSAPLKSGLILLFSVKIDYGKFLLESFHSLIKFKNAAEVYNVSTVFSTKIKIKILNCSRGNGYGLT